MAGATSPSGCLSQPDRHGINLIRSKQKVVLEGKGAVNLIQKSFYQEIIQYKSENMSLNANNVTKNNGNDSDNVITTKSHDQSPNSIDRCREVIEWVFGLNEWLIKFCKSSISTLITIILLFILQLFLTFHEIQSTYKFVLLLISELITVFIVFLKVRRSIAGIFSGQILALDIIFSSYSYIFLFFASIMFLTLDYSLLFSSNIRHQDSLVAVRIISIQKNDTQTFKIVTADGHIYQYINLPGQKLPDFVAHSLETKDDWNGRAVIKLLKTFSSSNQYVTATKFLK